MRIKLLALLGLLCLAATAFAQGLILQVGEASQVVVTKSIEELRSRGIIVTVEDAKRAKVIENHREALLQRMRDLAAYENAYRKTGAADRLAEIKADLKSVKDTFKRLPVSTDKQNYTKAMNEYYTKIAPTAAKRCREIDGDLKKFSGEIKPIYVAGGQRPTGGTGEGIKGGSIGNLEIYVQSISGDAEFYINGKKVAARSTIPISGEGAFLLAAKGKGKTFKMIENFTGGPNTEVVERTDDSLIYKVSSGTFNGQTSIRRKEDEADFLVVKQPNIHAQWHEIAPNKVKLTFDGAFTIGLSVMGKTTWARKSQRPAKTVEDAIEDEFKASITISVTGRGK